MSAADVPHTAQTDHRVLREYRNGNGGTAKSGELDIFLPQAMPVDRMAIQRAYGLQLSGQVRTRSQAAAAMNLLAPLAAQSENDRPVQSAVSWLLFYLGDNAAAVRAAERALELNAHDESAIEALATIHEHTDNLDRALEHADRLLELTPFSAQHHTRRGRILQKLNRHDEATEAFVESLNVNPLQHDVREELIKLLSSAGRQADAESERTTLTRLKTRLNSSSSDSEE